MGKILYLECNSGISGDMTVGALLDLGADQEVLEKALDSMGLEGYHLHFGRKETCGLDAFDFDVHLEEEGHGHGHEAGHEHSHSHGVEHEHGHSHGAEHGHSHGSDFEQEHGHSHGTGHSHEHHHERDDKHIHREPECVHDHGHAELHQSIHSHAHEGASHQEHAHHHSHVHRNLYDIYEIIERLEAGSQVKELARKMFRIVAEAESKAHGLPIDQVHFHEVGAIDSIIDIVSVAVCIHNLGIQEVVVSPLSEGHGHVHCQHGILPVPVPATANIVSAYGLELRLTDNEGEMVTPTGAAIAAALRTRKSLPDSCRLLKIGMGAGNKVFRQANVLRAMLLETEENRETKESDTKLWVMETNLDDSTGEMLGLAMETLLEAGAVDVWYTPIFMKKNRPAYQLSLLCRETDRELLEDILMTQTTTIGIRRYPVQRTISQRESRQVDTRYGRVEVKVCRHKDQVFFYPEYESIHKICKEGKADFQSVYFEARKMAEQEKVEKD